MEPRTSNRLLWSGLAAVVLGIVLTIVAAAMDRDDDTLVRTLGLVGLAVGIGLVVAALVIPFVDRSTSRRP